MPNMQEKAAEYIPLNTRLQTLKTRLDVPEYNEQQRLLFPNNCEELTKNVYKKVCRFITDCEIPSTDLCLVAINYKETMPPSHPRESLPINLLAELQTCCETGRITCPELIMYSIEPENSTEDMMLYKKQNIGLGDLKLGIDFKNRVHCCESEDSWDEGLESVDFIEVLPSINLDFSCDMGSIEYSREYYEAIELCYKRLEFLRKYHIWLDICNQSLSFDASVEPVSETCLACDTEYETSAETSVENACGNLTVKVKKTVSIDWCTPEFSEEFSIELSQECLPAKTYEAAVNSTSCSIYGTTINYKLKEKLTVDWCSGEITLEPELETECHGGPTQGAASSFPIDITIPGCSSGYDMRVQGTGSIQSTLKRNGSVSSKVSIPQLRATGRLGTSAYINFVESITQKDNTLEIVNKKLQFTDGLLCNVDGPYIDTINIDCIGSGDLTSRIDCYKLRKRCGYCECSDSSSSSSSDAPCPCTGTFTFKLSNSDVESRYEYSAPVAIRFMSSQRIARSVAERTNKDSTYSYYKFNVCGTEEELTGSTLAVFAHTGSNISIDVTLGNKDCGNSSSSLSDSSLSSSSMSASSILPDSSSSNHVYAPCTGELTCEISNTLYNDLSQPVLVTYTINGEQYTTAATATPSDTAHTMLTITAVGTEEEIRSITSITVTPTTDNNPRTISVILNENSINCGSSTESSSSSTESSSSTTTPEPAQCEMTYELRRSINSFDSDSHGMAIIDNSFSVFWNLDNNPLLGRPWGPVDAILQNEIADDNGEYVYRFTVRGTEEELDSITQCTQNMYDSSTDSYFQYNYTVSKVEGSLTCESNEGN